MTNSVVTNVYDVDHLEQRLSKMKENIEKTTAQTIDKQKITATEVCGRITTLFQGCI